MLTCSPRPGNKGLEATLTEYLKAAAIVSGWAFAEVHGMATVKPQCDQRAMFKLGCLKQKLSLIQRWQVLEWD